MMAGCAQESGSASETWAFTVHTHLHGTGRPSKRIIGRCPHHEERQHRVCEEGRAGAPPDHVRVGVAAVGRLLVRVEVLAAQGHAGAAARHIVEQQSRQLRGRLGTIMLR